MTARTSGRNRLATILVIVFLSAMVMGPGPGLRLVNPNPDNPNATFMILGMPVVYVWAILWYAILIAVVVAANILLWRPDCEEEIRCRRESTNETPG